LLSTDKVGALFTKPNTHPNKAPNPPLFSTPSQAINTEKPLSFLR